jgi:hypothetical protein
VVGMFVYVSFMSKEDVLVSWLTNSWPKHAANYIKFLTPVNMLFMTDGLLQFTLCHITVFV